MNGDQPAFPIKGSDGCYGTIEQEGMTYRQWLAGTALPSVIQGLGPNYIPHGYLWAATEALRFADALIAAQNQQEAK